MSGGLDELWSGVESGVDSLNAQGVFGSLALALALVFVISAVPKLRKPELAALAIVDFGVGRHPRPAAGIALGIAELALAVSLGIAAAAAADWARIVPALLVAGVLWVFVFLIARALRSSESFACFCFGSSEAAISKLTLIRTLGLACLGTLLAMAAPGISGSSPSASTWLLELVIAASAVGTVALLVSYPKILEVTE